MPTKEPKGRCLGITPANEHWGVSRRVRENGEVKPEQSFRKRFCKTCPWLKANVGRFPARAFELSAETAYDIPDALAHGSPSFACHSDGDRTCAGYIKSINGHNSLRVRLLHSKVPDLYEQISPPPSEAFDSYYEMAVANGVSPDSPALVKVRRK